jgi:hypothetical protein
MHIHELKSPKCKPSGRAYRKAPTVSAVSLARRLPDTSEISRARSPRLEKKRRIGTRGDQTNRTNEYTVQIQRTITNAVPICTCACMSYVQPPYGLSSLKKKESRKIYPRTLSHKTDHGTTRDSSTPKSKSAVIKADYTAHSSTHSDPKRISQLCNPSSSSDTSCRPKQAQQQATRQSRTRTASYSSCRSRPAARAPKFRGRSSPCRTPRRGKKSSPLL